MVDVITANSSALLDELYCDNFFASHSLMSDLEKNDVGATETIRENRTTNANQKIISSKQRQTQERECFEYYCNRTVYITKYHDNSVVAIASNWESHTPVHKIRPGKGKCKRSTISFIS